MTIDIADDMALIQCDLTVVIFGYGTEHILPLAVFFSLALLEIAYLSH